jgi:hypothetical protein
VVELRKFDRILKARTNNVCGCELGGKELRVDFNHVFEDAREFLEFFQSNPDCGVNSFLRLNSPGRAATLLAAEAVLKTTSGAILAKYSERREEIDCRRCGSIGDAVIALEQGRPWCLAHIDRDFSILCEARGRTHKPIASLRAAEGRVS